MDPILKLEDVNKAFGTQQVLKDFCLSVEIGEFVTLLGPSGCGKTTALNLIAGFLQPDSGTIYLRGRTVNDLEPRKRQLGMVFQTWALFPHMNAYENVAFGLRMRGKSKADIDRKVKDMLELVRLPSVANKYPSQLSGGMRQRVALARALAVEPNILLLDEPLSNLDAALRKEMQVELKRIHEQLRVTTVFVTHNQEEALVMSNRVAVMMDGKIKRIDSPINLYNDPRSKFVCTFLGDANIFEGEVTEISGTRAIIKSGGLVLTAPSKPNLQVGKAISLAVRPESIVVKKETSSGADNSFKARIKEVVYKGNSITYYLEIAGREVVALEYQKGFESVPERNAELYAEFEATAFSVLEEE
jgi:putative spermidine/putrescine transport system ATP-binding protein